MAIEDTVGYRFVRISLVLLNCLVLVRLVSLLLQYSHVFEPTFVLFVLLIGSNFMAAIIGAIREHRISVMATGSITLIMFLSLIFTAKENKSVNVSLLTLLAIAVQSLIFSEMLKERQTLIARREMNYISSGGNNRSVPGSNPSNLAAVVVYQTGSNRGHPGSLFMIDPVLGAELPKDAPPSYFATNCPPPKYEDAIKLNANDQSLPAVVLSVNEESPNQCSSQLTSTSSTSTITSPVPLASVVSENIVVNDQPQSSQSTTATTPAITITPVARPDPDSEDMSMISPPPY